MLLVVRCGPLFIWWAGMDCQQLRAYIWNSDAVSAPLEESLTGCWLQSVYKEGRSFFKEYLQCMIDKCVVRAARRIGSYQSLRLQTQSQPERPGSQICAV